MMNWNALVLDSDWSTLLLRQVTQITVLIVVAGLATRFCLSNRPRMAHTLWALVLIKCLTPPIVALPISPFSWHASSKSDPTKSAVNAKSTNVQRALPEERSRGSVGPESETQARPLLAGSGFEIAAPVDASVLYPEVIKPQRGVNSDAEPVASTWSVTGLAVTAWLAGGVAALVVVTLRLMMFLRRVRRDRVQPCGSTLRLLSDTATGMQLSSKRTQRVRIDVVDSLIGPAVIGIWRPTILLPRVLEQESSPAELRMLLAHELVHIQRSDLRWALIKTVVGCLWWFHPLMWKVQRTFSRITELSCDEEVIERLKCKPSEYARALLMVLERKHQLRVAPALPGVRPVDITSERMERVMKFDRKQVTRPWKIALFWLVGVALVLPGAGWVAAGDNVDDDKPDSRHRGVSPPQAVADAWVKNTNPEAVNKFKPDVVAVAGEATVRRYSASQAIAKIRAEDQISEEQAATILNASLDSLAGERSGVIVTGDQVVVRAREDVHGKIAAELERIALFGFAKQVVIATRVCKMPKADFDELDVDWKLVRNEQKQQPVVASLLSPARMDAAIRFLQRNEPSGIVMAPKVTTFNGRRADVEARTQRPFCVTGEPSGDSNSSGIRIDRIGRIEKEGFALSVLPLHAGDETQLDVAVSLSKIADVSKFTFRTNSNRNVTVEVPDVIEQAVEVSMAIPSGQTLALGMPSVEVPGEVLVFLISAEAILENQVRPAVQASGVSLPRESLVEPVVFQSTGGKPLPKAQPSPAVKPDESDSLATWLMKADGGATPNDTNRRVDQLLVPFGAKARMEGDWIVQRDGDQTRLSGRNLSISPLTDIDEGVVLRCAEGSLLIDPAGASIVCEAASDAQWFVSIDDDGLRLSAARIALGPDDGGIQATGEPAKVEIAHDDVGEIAGQAKQVSYGSNGLELVGNVQFSFSNKSLKAERVEFKGDETLEMLLRGNVHMTSNDDSNPTEVRCEELQFNLSTGQIQFVE